MGWRSRVKWGLLGGLIGVVVLVGVSALMPARVTRTVEVIANSALAGRARTVKGQSIVLEDTRIEMEVEMVGISEISSQPVVVLKEKGGGCYLPIFIGLFEANAISVAVEGVSVPRPLSPDLTCSILSSLGASVDAVSINEIRDNTFYATIILVDNWARVEIDSRPSDAIAIALRVGAPIYAEEVVLEKAGIRPSQDGEEALPLVLERRRSDEW